MSAQDVAAITGGSLEYIQKFEGPVLAEREFVIDTALAVVVHAALETDPMAKGASFGSVIRERLHDLGATGERWASWKETGVGWIVKLSFTADEVEHDARWNFEPKKLALSPMNNEALTLSQQGEAVGALIPRLRAVGNEEPEPDASRFDSGAFDLGEEQSEPKGPAAVAQGTSHAAFAPREEPVDHNQTADLLEALRRRRGEREAASFDDDSPTVLTPTSGVPSPMHPSTGGIRIVDVPLDDFDGTDEEPARSTAPQPLSPQSNVKPRKGRQEMPSWDEIVFGARTTDDDLA